MVNPVAFVDDPFLVDDFAFPVEKVVHESALVFVWERTLWIRRQHKPPLPVLHVILPLALIHIPVGEPEGALSLPDSELEVSEVHVTLMRLELSFPMRQTILPLAFEHTSVCELFRSEAVLFVLQEASLVPTSRAFVLSSASELSLHPVAFIDVSMHGLPHTVPVKFGAFPFAADYFVSQCENALAF